VDRSRAGRVSAPGVRADAPSNASKAQEYLEKFVAAGVTTFVEYRAAQVELGRLKR
jgi:hypothetical protein